MRVEIESMADPCDGWPSIRDRKGRIGKWCTGDVAAWCFLWAFHIGWLWARDWMASALLEMAQGRSGSEADAWIARYRAIRGIE